MEVSNGCDRAKSGADGPCAVKEDEGDTSSELKVGMRSLTWSR